MGEYDKKIATNNLTFKGDYELCANYKKEPIFKSNENALEKIKTDHKETLDAIRETFKLEKFSKDNLSDYQKYSSQLIATSDETKKDAADLSVLLEIYQNGQKTK